MRLKEKDKPYNNGQWTHARFVSFVKSALRNASMRWGPKNEVKKRARVARGRYLCQGYNREPHIVTATVYRKKNVFVDHIIPIVDPEEGFTTWDDFIYGLFCEEDRLQVLCKECHDCKSKDEREQRKKKNDS